MGLAICRRIIDEHCGDIFVESKTDKGTQFSVLLPVDRKENMNDG
jgi:signal transduction histidine kinase